MGLFGELAGRMIPMDGEAVKRRARAAGRADLLNRGAPDTRDAA